MTSMKTDTRRSLAYTKAMTDGMRKGLRSDRSPPALRLLSTTTRRPRTVSVLLPCLTSRSSLPGLHTGHASDSPTGLLGLGARANIVRFRGAWFAFPLSVLRLLLGDTAGYRKRSGRD